MALLPWAVARAFVATSRELRDGARLPWRLAHENEGPLNSLLQHLIPVRVLLALRGRSRQWIILRANENKIIQDEDIWICDSSRKHNSVPLPPRKVLTLPVTCVSRWCPRLPWGSSLPSCCHIRCLNLPGGIARGMILSAKSYRSRFLQHSI